MTLPRLCKAQSGIQPLSESKSHTLCVLLCRACEPTCDVCGDETKGGAVHGSSAAATSGTAGQRSRARLQFWRLPTGSSPTVITGARSGPVPARWRRSQCDERHSNVSKMISNNYFEIGK